MIKILQIEEDILRKKSEEIPLDKITSPKIKKILKDMVTALRSQSDGVAIAAPQIGYSLRIFIVSGRIFSKNFTKGEPMTAEELKELDEIKDVVFINPRIGRLSKEKEWMTEGCLSVRPFYGKTLRSKKATVTAYDENGKKFTRGASGLLAQIFQHETDHLNGILFVDHAKDVKAEKIELDAK